MPFAVFVAQIYRFQLSAEGTHTEQRPLVQEIRGWRSLLGFQIFHLRCFGGGYREMKKACDLLAVQHDRLPRLEVPKRIIIDEIPRISRFHDTELVPMRRAELAESCREAI